MGAKTTRFPGRAPSHPGAMLRDIVLPNAGLPVSQAAQRLGVSRQTLHRLLAGTVGLTPSMALRLSRLFGSTPDFWLRMQLTYDLWHASQAMADELAKIEPVDRAA